MHEKIFNIHYLLVCIGCIALIQSSCVFLVNFLFIDEVIYFAEPLYGMIKKYIF